jgi:hypothetical protein
MEKLIVNNDNEKRCIFSEILKMQRDGIISNSDTLKTLQFASNNIRNKYNKPIIERSSYHSDDSIDSKDLSKMVCSIVVRS